MTTALTVLSIACLSWGLGIAVYLVFDWLRLRRGLREDQQLDHWPVRGEPRWMRRSTNNWIHKP